MSIWSFKDKIGPGVSKDEEKAPAYIRFFKTYFMNFPKMVGLNLLYIFCCLPVVTIGPATAALCYVCRNYSRGVHVDPFHDFLKKCKENFKQGIIATIIYLIVAFLVIFSGNWYSNAFKNSGNFMFAIFLGLIFVVGFIAISSMIYLFPMMASFDLPLKKLFRNSLILSSAKIFRSVGLILATIVLIGGFAYFWQIGFVFLLFTNFSFVFLLNNFAVYPVLAKHIAKPQEEEGEADEEEKIFTDTVK